MVLVARHCVHRVQAECSTVEVGTERFGQSVDILLIWFNLENTKKIDKLLQMEMKEKDNHSGKC